MLSIRRWAVSLVVLTLLLAAGAAAWLYYGQLPKKVPLRARPVFAEKIIRQPVGGQNPPAVVCESKHNKWNIEHTIAVPKFQQGGI